MRIKKSVASFLWELLEISKNPMENREKTNQSMLNQLGIYFLAQVKSLEWSLIFLTYILIALKC